LLHSFYHRFEEILVRSLCTFVDIISYCINIGLYVENIVMARLIGIRNYTCNSFRITPVVSKQILIEILIK
jgi:hypothetical protein